MGAAERIKELEEELRTTKYNKATQGHIGLVKAKLAKLKGDVEKKSGGGGRGEGFTVSKSGDASVVLLGFPSVGKSTLLTKLTDARSEAGAYAFTTLTMIPGMLKHKHAKIQILDVPGIVHGAASGRGRGKEVLAAIRNADMILVLLDALHPEHYEAILKEVWETGIRINQTKPDVKIKKKEKGGVSVGTTVHMTKMTKSMVEGICREMGLVNCDVLIRTDIDQDQLIDVIAGNRVYMPAITVVNKADLVNKERREELREEVNADLFISAHKEENIERLKDTIFDALSFIRIYLKEVGKKPDLEEPLIMRQPCTIRHVCAKLHRDFVRKFRYARLWGPSAKFDGQQIRKLGKQLHDNDILEIHLI